MGLIYMGIGLVLLLWGGSQFRRGFKPFRLRPYLMIILGGVMIYNGLRLEEYIR